MALKKIRGFEFDKSAVAFEAIKKTMPKIIANQSKNHFLEGFRKGGGQTDDSKSGWLSRKLGSARDEGRAILVDTGALRRSIQVLKVTFNEIIIGTKRIVYADRHNEGITDKLGRQMPKREFIGKSSELESKNKQTIIKTIARIF